MHFRRQPSPHVLAPITELQVVKQERACVELSNGREAVELWALEDGVFQLKFNRIRKPLPRHSPELAGVPAPAADARLTVHDAAIVLQAGNAAFRIALDRFAMGLSLAAEGRPPRRPITMDASQIAGFCGDKFGLGLRLPGDTPFYGFGEKTGLLNKNGARMKFWNVDVGFDHDFAEATDRYDPTYVSIPVAIWPTVAGEDSWAKDGRPRWAYAAMLIDNVGPTWFNCASGDFGEANLLYAGSYTGEPSFYFIVGDTMEDVCVKLLRLTGTPAMPPLWALGNHQCRYAYDREWVFKEVAEAYHHYGIPLHGLWFDIDYMDRFRVFSWDQRRFPSPEKLSAWLAERGVRTVTIIDPGIAVADDNPVYVEGTENDAWCRSPSGLPYVGMVWPGQTVFPDFSLQRVRDWWAQRIARHLSVGLAGIWNDMNDPATGMADGDDMLFGEGAIEHDHLRNAYANFMAQATWDGFRKHDATMRPFVLTRSACTGIQRWAAVWTGDNASNWAHLRMAIPEALNLALSGVSFNGCDIGGFFGTPTPELLIRWYQAALLFPFFRNHSDRAGAGQEPWNFNPETTALVADIVNLRYRLLGYLYTQFAHHIETGAPVLRPMCYFCPEPDYADVGDQYAVGSDVIIAPIVDVNRYLRHVLLPPGRWFDLSLGTWHEGGRIFIRKVVLEDVPIYVREGTILCEPVPPNGEYFGWDCDLTKASWRLHVFGDEAAGRQVIDDGRTYTEAAPKALEVRFSDDRFEGRFPLDRVTETVRYGSSAERPRLNVADRVFELDAKVRPLWNRIGKDGFAGYGPVA